MPGRVQQGRGLAGIGNQRDAGQRAGAERESERAERHDLRDLGSAESQRRVDPVADRATRECRNADVVADRVRDKGREGVFRPRQRPSDVTERQSLVAGEDQVAAGGQRDREQHPPVLYCGELGEDVPEVEFPAEPVQGNECRAEERSRHERRKVPSQHGTSGGYVPHMPHAAASGIVRPNWPVARRGPRVRSRLLDSPCAVP